MELPLNAEGWTEIVARCWDNALNTQPTYVRSAWNWGLHVTSSCHRAKIYSVNKSKPLIKRDWTDNGIGFTPIRKWATASHASIAIIGISRGIMSV